MKFAMLQLERYGHFTDRTLDFGGDDVLLHIVHGPNESGKSTILSAISDLLFGFPAQTTFNFQHDYRSLRIGAEIVAKSGAELAFKRRKGNAGTLASLGPHEVTLPDGALVPFLGDADRGLFERMFGLDHERLRAAGERMIANDGDLGRGLFEAGSGLSKVNRVIDDLQAELDKLGVPERRSAKKPLWQASDDFAEAQRAKRQHALKHEEYQAAETALEAAIVQREQIKQALTSIRESRSRLERIRRIAPILSEIDRLSHEIAEYAEVPDLPSTFEADWRERAETSILAKTAQEAARAASEILAQELDAIPNRETLTPFAAEIRLLQEKLGEYVKGIADEPKLDRDIASRDEDIDSLIKSLGLETSPARVVDLVPKPALVAKIRAALREGDNLKTRRETAELEASKAARRLADAERDLAELTGATDPAEAQSLVEAATRLGGVTSAVEERRKEAESAMRAADEALRRVSGWSLGIEALAATPFPDADTLRDFEERSRILANGKEAAVRAKEAGEAEWIESLADIAGLEAVGEIPSAEAVGTARDRRDDIWRLIRTGHLDAARGSAPDDDLVGAYEASRRHADELADRRMAEAHRVARFADLTARKARLSQQISALRERLERSEHDLESFWTEWHDLWAQARIAPEVPVAMRAWLTAKDEALRGLLDQRLASEKLERAMAEAARARDLLGRAARSLGLTFADEVSLDNLDQAVRAALKDHESLWKKRQAGEDRADRERKILIEKRGEAARLEGEARIWREKWEHLVGAIGCAVDAGPDEAEAVLSIWDRMRDPLTKRTEFERRLRGLRDDNENFRVRTQALVADIARAAAEFGKPFSLDRAAAPDAIIRDLAGQLGAETLRLAKHADIATRLGVTHATFAKASADLAAAQTAANDFCRLHHLDTAIDLRLLGARASKKRLLLEALREGHKRLANGGDGFDEASLRSQVLAAPPDAVAAELQALIERETELIEAGQAAAQAELQARQGLDALRARTGAAEADLEARNATLAFAGHAERWLLLRTAQHLMNRAVERYRAENEHPMIRRAGELLARIAGSHADPIVKLDVDYRDGKGPAIVCARRDGRRCDIGELSEGTRDQLFLCLRIAAIELYAKEREPLPFIGDDLFITSDDTRVIPGLAALAELGRTTQVILFTHHRHVVEAARVFPRGSVKIHDLSVLPDSPVARECST